MLKIRSRWRTVGPRIGIRSPQLEPALSEGFQTMMLTEHKRHCRQWDWGHKYMLDHNKKRNPIRRIKPKKGY